MKDDDISSTMCPGPRARPGVAAWGRGGGYGVPVLALLAASGGRGVPVLATSSSAWGQREVSSRFPGVPRGFAKGAARVSKDGVGRGLHSSAFQLNLSRF